MQGAVKNIEKFPQQNLRTKKSRNPKKVRERCKVQWKMDLGRATMLRCRGEPDITKSNYFWFRNKKELLINPKKLSRNPKKLSRNPKKMSRNPKNVKKSKKNFKNSKKNVNKGARCSEKWICVRRQCCGVGESQIYRSLNPHQPLTPPPSNLASPCQFLPPSLGCIFWLMLKREDPNRNGNRWKFESDGSETEKSGVKLQ